MTHSSESKDKVLFWDSEDSSLSHSPSKSFLVEPHINDTSPVHSDESPKKPVSAIGENGEINWDCPCLAGALQPPCGEAFKAAFSCFVYSKSEPKGVECEEAFLAMKKCFQEHPEIYQHDDDNEDEDDNNNNDNNEKKIEDEQEKEAKNILESSASSLSSTY